MKKLTNKQNAMLAFIERYHKKHGYSPTLTIMAKHFDVNVSVVHTRLKALERKGYLVKDGTRAIRLLEVEI